MANTPTKNHFLILIIATLLASIWVAYDTIYGTPNTTQSPTTNADMLQQPGGMPIVTESDVEYYPSAKGYFAMPKDEGAYPGIIMIHENRGLRPEIRDTANLLARQGYMVLAVDLLYGIAEDQDGARALTANFSQEDGTANMRAAVQYLKQRGASKLASLGWCFGGRQSVQLAISGEPLDATIVYYGSGIPTTPEALKPISWPVLGIFGGQDTAIPVSTVIDFEASLNELGIPNAIHLYPNVGHAFANPSGANYAPNETQDAWQKTVEFLDETLKQ